MAWMEMLYRTYEANAEMAGKTDEATPLNIVAHMTATAQLEISIDLEGNFMGACEVDKKAGRIIIPVTEASAARTSSPSAHGLCDMLSYIAGDYNTYGNDKKAQQKFTLYSEALGKWCASSFAHPKAKAVYAYIMKQTVVGDLIKCGLLKCDESGKLDGKKVNGQPPEKALVRFRILGTTPDAVWEDASLFDSFTSYYLESVEGKRDICYLTGKKAAIATVHPKGILASSYGAKLISANDSTNFVYRGRFAESEEACAISFEATQKAHSALTWLAARQGVYVGTKSRRTYVCWNPNGKEVVDFKDPFGFSNDETPCAHTEEEFKKRLTDTLSGYRGKLDNCDDIVVMGLDAATTGRLSVTYYSELKGSDFYDRLDCWSNTCKWYFTRFTTDKKPFRDIMTPLTKLIVSCAFGSERGAFVEVDERIMKEQVQRLYSCMLDGNKLPYDIVHALAIRASNPQAYSFGNYERLLSTACAMIVKYYNDYDKGEIKMTLDTENTDRSYLFGRLLAVLEKAERLTFSRDETREPNAIRLQNVYVSRPMTTWKTLDGLLVPYFKQLSTYKREEYKGLISDIIGKIASGDADRLNKPLDEIYLIGYYLQRAELNTYNKNNKED